MIPGRGFAYIMRRFFALVPTLTLAVALPACGTDSAADEPLDGEDEAFGGPKADGFCVDEGTIEAVAVLQLVNSADISAQELDRSASEGGAGLNKRAADNIVAARPIETLTDLDAVPFVGVDSCAKLVTFACETKGLCEAPAAACDVGNASKREFDLVALADPIAELVLKSGDGCPSTYVETMEKLRKTDTQGCDSSPSDGISTAIVTEEGQVGGEFESGRSVITRTCGGREEHDVFFSLFGVSAGSSLPGNAEVMAFDRNLGVYNYYTLEGGEWEFHGNSIDLVTTGTQRCAACHTGGGPIMKELDTPWLHWEGHQSTAGVGEFIDGNDDLGSHSDGASVEFLVKEGNRDWNEARLSHLRDNGSVADVLRPLFCTVEVNLDNGADFFSSPDGTLGGGDDLDSIPRDFLLDRQWSGFGTIKVASAVYEQAIRDAGQRLMGDSGQLTDANGNPAIDTIFDFVFPERSFADNDYVERLVAQGIIDDDFVKDVLAIDFTAPIFSETRCDLLQFAPELDAADMKPDAIRTGFLANLPSSGAGAELAGHLGNNADAGDHQAAVDAFVAACDAREEADFMADCMKIVSQRRAQARELTVFEFAATMPQDTLNVSAEARFNPTTCVVE
jgi:hypothetical protein